MTKKSVGSVLGEFSKDGFPQGEGVLSMQDELEQATGMRPTIRGSIYPELRADNQQGFRAQGRRWSFEFPNGQALAVVVSDSGEIIKREYTDRGDVHFDQVIKLMRGWQKSIEQAQRGGVPKGIREETAKEYMKIGRDFERSNRSEQEFYKGRISKTKFYKAMGYYYAHKTFPQKR